MHTGDEIRREVLVQLTAGATGELIIDPDHPHWGYGQEKSTTHEQDGTCCDIFVV